MEVSSYINTANRACSLIYSCIKKHSNGTWLLPVNVCPDVPLTFCLANVKFQFVDIDPETLCMDINKVLQLLEDNPAGYAGILFVRSYGFLFDTTNVFASIKARSNMLYLIDDRCLCMPDFAPNLYGSDMVLYSTGHRKQIDFGGGGFACYGKKTDYKLDLELYYDGTDEQKVYKEAFMHDQPLSEVPIGWLKMDTYLSPLDYVKKVLTHEVQREKKREELNDIYSNTLPASIQFPNDFQTWRFNIKVPPVVKTRILQSLFNNDLFASSHYHSVNRLFNSQSFPVSDNLFDSVINLFNDNYYTPEKACRTCELINKHLGINN